MTKASHITTALIALCTLYLVASYLLFLKIYKTSSQIIDEEFHLRQGLHYCDGNFSVWDPKITTLPGLYVISTIVLLPFNACSAFNLRLISLAASALNLVLIFKLRWKYMHRRPLHALTEALTIAMLPPLYFFSHLYYTDTCSVTAILLMLLAAQRDNHSWGALAGAASILIRQTNVVWVAMIFCCKALEIAIDQTTMTKRKAQSQRNVVSTKEHEWKELISGVRYYFRRPVSVVGSILIIAAKLTGYIAVLCGFVGFVFVNGSIVVGDKSAHEASVHLAQINYFLLFFAFFSPGYIVEHGLVILRKIHRSWLTCTLMAGLMVAVSKYNSLVHPYLLADNRHYTFYVWNRFYGRFGFAKYIPTPVCVAALILAANLTHRRSICMRISFVLFAGIVLTMQKMIEIRYFIVPFILLRLNAEPMKFRNQIGECIYYVCVNAITLYIFFTKEIFWTNFTEPQRLIW